MIHSTPANRHALAHAPAADPGTAPAGASAPVSAAATASATASAASAASATLSAAAAGARAAASVIVPAAGRRAAVAVLAAWLACAGCAPDDGADRGAAAAGGSGGAGLSGVETAGGAGGAGEAGGWVDASAAVLAAVHSVWGTVPALEDSRWVHRPLGTAFVIREDGYLVTNAHVVARQDGLVPRLRVVVQSDTGTVTYPAEVVATDAVRDLALVRIPATGLIPVRWTEEEAPMGTPLATIGYGLPEGGIVDTTAEAVTTRYTVFRRFTAGHSSGYRTLVRGNPATNVLEVDLFLFPGVSGGPAFRSDGRLVGVNRGHLQFREGASSYGHLIPTQVVRDFLEAVDAETDAGVSAVFSDSASALPAPPSD